MIPKNFKLQYSQQQIKSQVEQVGTAIGSWADQVWQDSHTDVLAIPVLRGGLFFFADLVRKIQASVEISPVRSWAYEIAQNAALNKDVKINIDGVPAKGRRLLLVDDICDSGVTLQVLTKALKAGGALEVRSAVLIKRVSEKPTFDPDWVAFNYDGPEWFVGYGMEDSERWRNLPDIYVIQQS